MTRLATPITDSRDANRQSIGGFFDIDTAYSLAFSRPLSAAALSGFDSGVTSLGLNVKYVQSQIASYKASAFAFDMGAIHQMDRYPMTLGVSVMNIGRPMRFLDQADPLPLTVAVGSTYRLAGALMVALDVSREVVDQNTDVRVGCEYSLLPSFTMRMGHESQFSPISESGDGASGLGLLAGLGAGFGLKLGRYSIDYGFTPFGNELGNIQRISLAVRFGAMQNSGMAETYAEERPSFENRFLNTRFVR